MPNALKELFAGAIRGATRGLMERQQARRSTRNMLLNYAMQQRAAESAMQRRLEGTKQVHELKMEHLPEEWKLRQEFEESAAAAQQKRRMEAAQKLMGGGAAGGRMPLDPEVRRKYAARIVTGSDPAGMALAAQAEQIARNRRKDAALLQRAKSQEQQDQAIRGQVDAMFPERSEIPVVLTPGGKGFDLTAQHEKLKKQAFEQLKKGQQPDEVFKKLAPKFEELFTEAFQAAGWSKEKAELEALKHARPRAYRAMQEDAQKAIIQGVDAVLRREAKKEAGPLAREGKPRQAIIEQLTAGKGAPTTRRTQYNPLTGAPQTVKVAPQAAPKTTKLSEEQRQAKQQSVEWLRDLTPERREEELQRIRERARQGNKHAKIILAAFGE